MPLWHERVDILPTIPNFVTSLAAYGQGAMILSLITHGKMTLTMMFKKQCWLERFQNVTTVKLWMNLHTMHTTSSAFLLE